LDDTNSYRLPYLTITTTVPQMGVMLIPTCLCC